MNYWMKTIINRLETAYQTRFDMKASLVFLNDAYQNSIELVKAVDEQPSNELEEFLDLFMTTRDLFIRQKHIQIKGTLQSTWKRNYSINILSESHLSTSLSI